MKGKRGFSIWKVVALATLLAGPSASARRRSGYIQNVEMKRQ